MTLLIAGSLCRKETLHAYIHKYTHTLVVLPKEGFQPKQVVLTELRLEQLLRIFRALTCFITFSTRWFKCCKRVNIPSATLQRVDNFVSGKHFATL